MIICIAGNALVLAAILKTPSLRSPSIIFLCNLAVSDILVGLVVQPIYIAYELKSGALLTDALNTLFSLAGCVSLCTMTAISVERFMALHYHMRYQNLMTEKYAIYTAITLWCFGIVLSTLTLRNTTVMFAVLVVGIAICILISTFSYIRIYLIVRRHQLQIQIQQQAVQSLNREHNINLMRSKKSAASTFIYYICMILCYSPIFTFMLVVAIHPNLSGLVVWKIGNTLVFMNSSINPILFCWRLSELRTAVLKIVRPRYVM